MTRHPHQPHTQMGTLQHPRLPCFHGENIGLRKDLEEERQRLPPQGARGAGAMRDGCAASGLWAGPRLRALPDMPGPRASGRSRFQFKGQRHGPFS